MSSVLSISVLVSASTKIWLFSSAHTSVSSLGLSARLRTAAALPSMRTVRTRCGKRPGSGQRGLLFKL